MSINSNSLGFEKKEETKKKNKNNPVTQP